jgi:hypothetical protein
VPFRRVLRSAERLSDAAMRVGSFHVNTVRCKSSASLCVVTDADHCVAARFLTGPRFADRRIVFDPRGVVLRVGLIWHLPGCE